MFKAVASYVSKSEFTQVAQTVGHQESDDGPAHEKADGVDQAVIAGRHHGRRDAQEGRGRHVVPRDRQAILEARDTTTSGIKISR